MELAFVLIVIALICGVLAPYPAGVILAISFGLAGLWVLLRARGV